MAVEVAEGFCEWEEASDELRIEAWSYLIQSKLAYQLQGWFGRTAESYIEIGLIAKDGKIDWDKFDHLQKSVIK
jgi:hypothetical protein